jgi:hypothetical protein
MPPWFLEGLVPIPSTLEEAAEMLGINVATLWAQAPPLWVGVKAAWLSLPASLS